MDMLVTHADKEPDLFYADGFFHVPLSINPAGTLGSNLL